VSTATLPDTLTAPVRALFGALEHAGDPDEGDGQAAAAGRARLLRGEAGREVLGTRVRFALRIAGERLVEVRYRAYGCPHTLATCEWLARALEGRRFEGPAALEGQVGSPPEWARQLGVPQHKLGRLLVIEDALRAALRQP